MSSATLEAQKQEASPVTSKFTFRCWVYQERRNSFVAECIDLNLIVKAKSMKQATDSLQDAIRGYLAVAFDGDIKGLIPRPSPLRRRLLYHLCGLRCRLRALLPADSSNVLAKRFTLSSDGCRLAAC